MRRESSAPEPNNIPSLLVGWALHLRSAGHMSWWRAFCAGVLQQVNAYQRSLGKNPHRYYGLGSGTAKTRMKPVIEKRAQIWKIIASQNTEIAALRF